MNVKIKAFFGSSDTLTVSMNTSLLLGIVGQRVAVRVPGCCGGGGVNVFADSVIDPMMFPFYFTERENCCPTDTT